MTLVLLRHGRSEWNLQNRFTGWADAPLSAQGAEDARRAGTALRGAGFTFDFAACSVLRRAVETMWEVQRAMDLRWLPTHPHWRLNERHYGALQGKNKSAAAAEFGEAQVREWRRGYDARPPLLAAPDPAPDHRYEFADPPRGESLADARRRVAPFYDEQIIPWLRAGQRPLIVAHGNILRALTMHIENADAASGGDIATLEIPTAVPLIYRLDERLRPTGRGFLG